MSTSQHGSNMNTLLSKYFSISEKTWGEYTANKREKKDVVPIGNR